MSFEKELWDTANKLRGSVESSEYKHVVLSLIFLKFASDKFEERRQELIDEDQEQYTGMVEFYAMKNIFFLTEESRWSYIKQQAKQEDIATRPKLAALPRPICPPGTLERPGGHQPTQAQEGRLPHGSR